jgi:type IV pilus assembly protein PilY1
MVCGLPQLLGLGGLLCGSVVSASTLTVVDNFTGTANAVNWYAYGLISSSNSTKGVSSPGACLTAGSTSASSSSAATSSNAGIIPACGSGSGGTTGTIPDTSGKGALRLTNSNTYQAGGIIYAGDSSGYAFPANTGINATWTSYSYGGSGADGLSFFLLSSDQKVTAPSSLGANGGSLGYSCSNESGNTSTKLLTAQGLTGIHNGYLAIGMDEYGNFSNKSDNTATGNSSRTAGSIAIRGKGDISNDTYGSYSNSSIISMCNSGSKSTTTTTTTTGKNGKTTTTTTTSSTAIDDYPFYSLSGTTSGVYNVSSSTPLYNSASTRASAMAHSYQLQITTGNLLTLRYSYNGGTWTTIANGIDITSIGGTLPSYLTFGFAASTGGSTNYHEITCFQAAPLTTSNSGAGLNQQSSEVQTGSQAYLAYYNSSNWYGGVTSNAITADSSGTVSVASTATWDGGCGLTGGSCSTTGTTIASAQGSSSRSILSWNDSSLAGVAFQLGNLSSTQQTALGSSSTLLAYLRGDRSNETSTYRARTSVMGDVINSSPTWVGPPLKSYTATWSDKIISSASLPENGSSAVTYPTFAANNLTRTNLVFVGANDGMLHGYRSGAYNSSGVYDSSSTNDGKELLAYVPGTAVTSYLSSYSNIIYSHAYFVDATPTSGDVFYNNSWHTWLVGGMGTGGKGIYALDVTTPANFSESNAASLVKGEWNSATLSCTYSSGSCASDLGYTVGTPVITRFHNGKWGAVFGNGYNSSTGVASIFVMMIDPSTGAETFYEYSTGYGPSKDPTGNKSNNGIYYVTPVDLDSDNIADYVYAGDLFGNMWRFDLTSSDPSKWVVSSYSGSKQPLFSTGLNSSGTLQPITTKPVVATLKASSTLARVMVYFGTGSKVSATVSSSSTYASGDQYFYGVWDWNVSAWNALSSTQFATTSNSPGTLSASQLVTQTLSSTTTSSSTTVATYGSTSSNTVCWVDSSSCSSNTQYGWKFYFPYSSSQNEQLIYNPQYLNGAITFSSTIPATNNITSCTNSVDTGWSYALSPASGGNFTTSYFANSSGSFSGVNGLVVNAVQLSATGSFQVVTYSGATYLVYQTSSGYATGNVIAVNTQGVSTSGSRLTWIELR